MEVFRKYYDQLENNNNNNKSCSNNSNNNNNNNNCNCKSKEDCPMGGICNLKNVVYQATIFPKENIKDKKIYIGISSFRWK